MFRSSFWFKILTLGVVFGWWINETVYFGCKKSSLRSLVNLSDKTCKILGSFLQDPARYCSILAEICKNLAKSARNARSWKILILARKFWFVLSSCNKCLLSISDISLQDSFKKLARFFCTCQITPFLQDPCKYLWKIIQGCHLDSTIFCKR